MLLKAATTATDQGEFEAVISTATIDRDGDIVEPSAIVKALGKWAALGKLMPLAYSHRDPKTGHSVIVGHIDPASARVQGKEVVAKGWVDQTTERGAETWRLVKSGTLSFSYGYLVPDGGATKRAGKQRGYHITAIDLYEVSVVPVAPANNDTRVLGYKAMATGVSLQTLNAMIGLAQRYIDKAPDAEDAAEMRSILDDLKELVSDVDDAADQAEDADDGKALRRRAAVTTLDVVTGGEKPKAEPPEPKPDLEQELQEVKAQLAEMRESFENLEKQKADVTPRDPRRVDPLVAKADALALEVMSGGESLRKPSLKTTPSPIPRVSLAELRRQMHQATLDAMSGGITDEQV